MRASTPSSSAKASPPDDRHLPFRQGSRRPSPRRGSRPLGQGQRQPRNLPGALGLEAELVKLKVAVAAGADAVMDLSTGGDLDLIRAAIIKASPVSVGTVPVYQAAVDTLARHPAASTAWSPRPLRRHRPPRRDGVGFVTVHCGLTLQSLGHVRTQAASSASSAAAARSSPSGCTGAAAENPLYADYDACWRSPAATTWS